MRVRKKYRKLDQHIEQFPIVVDTSPIICKKSNVLTIGSCFALEVRNYLIDNGYNVMNNNESLDSELIWYNTFTILYEFQRVTGSFRQEYNDVWQLKDGTWQDPYRRHVVAPTKDELWDKIKDINARMDQYIREADVVVITLGLVEVFFQSNGNAICATPGYPKGKGGGQNSSFKFTEYGQNFLNINECVEILKCLNPSCHLIITTSPVQLARTFMDCDQLVANTEGKSILRAVCGAVSRRHENSHYYHSYEMANNYPKDVIYKPDARHVKPDFVAKIMNQFATYFVEGGS